MTATYIPASNEAGWPPARRKGITASEIAIVMGLSPYSSPYALYHQKLGNLPEPDLAEDMPVQLGTYMERFVAGRFADQRPHFFISGDGMKLYAHPERPWQMATPDRLVHEIERLSGQCTCAYPDTGAERAHEPHCGAVPGDVLAVLECKIDGGSDEWGEEGSDEIPVHYRCQVLWQMDVMGVSTGYVACLLWHRRQVRIYEITLGVNELTDLELMRQEAIAFRGRLDRGDPPDVDWRPATRDALKHLHPSLEDREVVIGRQLAISYAAAVRRYKEAERRKDEMTNRVLAAMGSARKAVDRTDRPVASRQVYDVKESVRKAYTVNKLVPARAPKETQ